MPEFSKDYVYANDKPGLGVAIDEIEAAKYPCENTVTTWPQTRLIDGTLQTPRNAIRTCLAAICGVDVQH